MHNLSLRYCIFIKIILIVTAMWGARFLSSAYRMNGINFVRGLTPCFTVVKPILRYFIDK